MGICPASPEEKDSKDIEDEIRRNRARDKLTKKLLLLGAGNSGKSTIFKQLKRIHGTGFKEKDVLDGLTTIYDSIVGQIKNIVALTKHLYDTDPEKFAKCRFEGELEESARFICDVRRENEVDEIVAMHIDRLWKSEAVQLAYENRPTLAIVDSCPHFFNSILRVGAVDYLPDEEDLLLVRSPTAGVIDASFTIEGNDFVVHDVGGQHAERRKWIHCFEGVTAVLFVASLSCYDQMLFEDENRNAMHDSIDLFDDICNSRWFRRTSIILFLNKSDLFREKILHVSLTKCFTDYIFDGDEADPIDQIEHAIEFIKNKYHETNRSKSHKHIYTHTTCATDQNNIKSVFNDVQHIVVNSSLQRGGLL